MANCTPLILLFAALLVGAPLTGCGGGDDQASAPTSEPGKGVKKDIGKKPGKDKAPRVWPTEPVEFATAPLNAPRPWGHGLKTGKVGGKHVQPATARQGETLPVGAKLETLEGKSRKLGKLIQGNSLVLYLSSDVSDRQNRAASRLLRKVVKSGRGLGFRTVLVFEKGTTADAVDEWFKKRHVEALPVAVIDDKGEFAEGTGWPVRSAGLVDADGVVALYFGPSEDWDSRLGFDGGLTSDILSRAWELPDSGPAVSAANKQGAVDLVRATLKAEAAGSAAPDGAAVSDPVKHGVWVSLYRPGRTEVMRGHHADGPLGAAVVAATRDALSRAGDARAEWLADAGKLKFGIDLAGEPGPLLSREAEALWYLVEPGVDGVILRQGDKRGVVLPHEPVTMGYLTPRVRNRTPKIEKLMKAAARDAGLTGEAWRDESAELLRFRTTNWGVVTPDGPATDFFRGNVLWDGTPSQADILESIKLGGQWLAYTVKQDGKFDYEYYPNQDKHSKDYNIVRHAGSVYGLFEMYELSKHEAPLADDGKMYLDKAARSMGFIYDALKAPQGDEVGDRICLLHRNRCESGSAALTLLTFLGRPLDPNEVPEQWRREIYRKGDDKLMEGLALTMVDMIDANGKVFRSYSETKKLDRVKKEPLYYPGEVMLALVRYHERTQDERWLAAARKIAERQMKWYKRDRFIVPDHWVMQGLYRLWRIDKNDAYADSAYAMATHYSSEQYPYVWQPFPDYFGSWRRTNDTPRTTRAGSRSEALRAVMHLAWERGDDATVYEDSLLWAARHLMEQQYTERNSYWVPNFEKVRGAYPMGVVDNHIRIDNNQHALVGITGALEAARHRAGE